MITSTEQVALAGIPDGEGEVADEVLRCRGAPLQVSGENQIDVGDDLAVGRCRPECLEQFLPVIDAGVGRYYTARKRVGQRLPLMLSLRRGMHGTVGQSNRPVGPCTDPIRTAVGHRCGHAPYVSLRNDSTIKSNLSGDCGHDLYRYNYRINRILPI